MGPSATQHSTSESLVMYIFFKGKLSGEIAKLATRGTGRGLSWLEGRCHWASKNFPMAPLALFPFAALLIDRTGKLVQRELRTSSKRVLLVLNFFLGLLYLRTVHW